MDTFDLHHLRGHYHPALHSCRYLHCRGARYLHPPVPALDFRQPTAHYKDAEILPPRT
jgi:hypothetical protein